MGKVGKATLSPTCIRVGGKYIELARPSAKVIDWPFIAHSLGGINRWLHHTNKPFTVLVHSLNVYARACELTPDLQVRKAALIHDAHEALTGDIASPIKRLVPEFREFEDGWQRATFKAAGLRAKLMSSAVVHRADLEVLAAEACAGFNLSAEEVVKHWALPYPPCTLHYGHLENDIPTATAKFLKLLKRL